MLRQIYEITLVNLYSIGSRRGASLVTAIGIAGVVVVFVATMSMAAGFRAALQTTSLPDRALIVRPGSASELSSYMFGEAISIASEREGIEIASPELFVTLEIEAKRDGEPVVTTTRGVTAAAFELRPELEIVTGRRFEPGRAEAIAGVGAVREFVGLEVGGVVKHRDIEWTVVGHFDTGGSVHDSELWVDLATIQSALRRGNAANAVWVRLDYPERAFELNAQLQEDPRITASLVPENVFFAQQSESRTDAIEAFAYLIGGIMALGAIIAALNTTYSAVASRTAEIATLKALGFGRLPIVASVVIEAMVLASVGGIAGAALAYLVFDGLTATSLNTMSNTQVAFAFAVTAQLCLLGLACALVLGFLGSLLPAVHAARLNIPLALRQK